MVTAGVDIARLKALLGHTDISVTQKYLHPRVDDLGDAVKSVEGL
jgi:site-specific recombinase XerD